MKIEVSIGEVVDKITILEIKNKRIKDENRLKHIRHELFVLQEALKNEGIKIPDELYNDLVTVNEKLWDTEEVIRKKEENKEFDFGFVYYARQDAILNDERFVIKRKINDYCDSLIKEEKSYEKLYKSN